MTNLEKLSDIANDNGGNRAFGHPGYDASVDFIYDELSKLEGFSVWKQDLSAFFANTTALGLTVNGESIPAVDLLYSPSTPEEGVTRELVLAPEGKAACSVDNYAGIDAKDKIVLVQRGSCSFAGKVTPAAAAGAVAVIVYNLPDTQTVTGGSLTKPDPNCVPAVFIDHESGRALKARLETGEKLKAHVTMIQDIEERTTQNIIAETDGGDGTNVIMLGAHLDSVPAGPGINDNGSGTTLILEVAKALSHFSTNLKVRFGWWAGEESGLYGSTFYVNNMTDQETESVLAYLNFDTVSRGFWGVYDGHGNNGGPAGPDGSGTIEDLFVKYFTAQGLEVTPVPMIYNTDSVPFVDLINKPVGGIFTGIGEYDTCYHQACDDFESPVPETITTNAKAVAHVLSVLATSGHELVPKSTRPRWCSKGQADQVPLQM